MTKTKLMYANVLFLYYKNKIIGLYSRHLIPYNIRTKANVTNEVKSDKALTDKNKLKEDTRRRVRGDLALVVPTIR